MIKTAGNRLAAAVTRGGGLYGRLCMMRYEHPVLFFGACMLMASLLFLALTGIAHPALADDNSNIAAGITSMAPWNWADGIVEACFKVVNINDSYLNQSFDAVLGKDSGAYGLISNVNNIVVKPISVSILAIVFLVEVAKIANDFEARGALPPFKDIIFMWVCCAVCLFIMNKSFDFCQDIFDMFNALIGSTQDIQADAPGTYIVTNEDEFVKMLDNALDSAVLGFLGKLLLGLIFFIECAVMSVVTYFSLLARGFQVYIYAALSPMMLAFLGSEKTQQWGISFIKSFLALCLAGLIMAIAIKLLPLATVGVAQSGPGGIVNFFLIVATFGVFIKAMASAGSWSKEILGG